MASPYARGEQKLYIASYTNGGVGAETRLRYVEDFAPDQPGVKKAVTLYDGTEKAIPIKEAGLRATITMLNHTEAEEFRKTYKDARFRLRWHRQEAADCDEEETYYHDCYLLDSSMSGMSDFAKETVTVIVSSISSTA